MHEEPPPRTTMSRLRDGAGPWLAALLSLLLVVPLGSWVLDTLSFRSAGQEVEDAVPRLADAVVLVTNLACDGRNGTGSGFATRVDGRPAVLTNRHVVEGASRVGLRMLDGSPGPAVDEVRLSTVDDVAVLLLADATGSELGLTRSPVPGDEVRLVGFPGARPITTAGEVSGADRERVRLSMRVDGGASGAPVVDEAGGVVAMIVARTPDGLGVAIPSARVSSALGALSPLPDC